MYPELVDLLLDRLARRPVLAGVALLDSAPTSAAHVVSDSGRVEVLHLGEASGVDLVEVITGPDSIRFTERLTLPLVVEVVGSDAADTAGVLRRRAGQLLAEVKAVLSAQNTWPVAATGLDVDYLAVVPGAVRWDAARLDAAGDRFAVRVVLDLVVTFRT